MRGRRMGKTGVKGRKDRETHASRGRRRGGRY
jgi:hypothetical protein